MVTKMTSPEDPQAVNPVLEYVRTHTVPFTTDAGDGIVRDGYTGQRVEHRAVAPVKARYSGNIALTPYLAPVDEPGPNLL